MISSRAETVGRCGLIVLVILGTAIVAVPFLQQSPADRKCYQAIRHLNRGDSQTALALVQEVLDESPRHQQALVIAGEAASRANRKVEALGHLGQVETKSRTLEVQACYRRGRLHRMFGHLMEAEDAYREALKLDPTHQEANRELAYMLHAQSRTWEATPLLLADVRKGLFSIDSLLMIGAGQQIFLKDEQLLKNAGKALPDDPLPLLPQSRLNLLANRFQLAEKQLREITRAHPDLLEPQAQLGKSLAERGELQLVADWHLHLPDNADDHPDIWFTRAIWARETGQTSAAVRCCLETLRRHPWHLEATYQLSQFLLQLGEKDHAKFFAERSGKLARLDYLLSELRGSPDLRMMQEVASLLENQHRYWEAISWAWIVMKIEDSVPWAQDMFARLRPLVETHSSLLPDQFNPAFQMELDRYDQFDWNRKVLPLNSRDSQSKSLVQFENQAGRAGLNYQYHNSMNPDVGLEHIFQTTGGGVSVLDYDQDGWPDLYFANGCALPDDPGKLNQDSGLQTDQLFRNLGNGQFEDVTALSGLGDRKFSQGVTAGDINNDGFPDLYVCNLGGNRLYQNLGDGTFQEISEQTQTAGNEWSMSSLLADLNGDSLPDLYVVNYLVKEEVYKRACKRDGQPLTCAPTFFAAEQDRLYLNLGDGRFKDFTNTSGIVVPDGKGLGIVAGDFDGSRRLSLFIGNDTTANSFFANQTAGRGGALKFEEKAHLTGVASDSRGKLQACMGIAAGDANRDGLIDLFVTNFYADSNTLYRLQPGGLFTDETRQANLRDSSFNLLGFGTQFLDGDLDGDLDLVITNGHVDQTFATGEPDLMAPQYLSNTGNGKYLEASNSAGPFFQEEHLGRSLAKLDWNRDGAEDFCVIHLDAPAGLLTNTTLVRGNFLVLKLFGVQADRDAVGTIVTVKSGDDLITHQLTAGDGYQASNEKILTFGLGEVDREISVFIDWTSGTQQEFKNIGVNRVLLCREGADPLVLKK